MSLEHKTVGIPPERERRRNSTRTAGSPENIRLAPPWKRSVCKPQSRLQTRERDGKASQSVSWTLTMALRFLTSQGIRKTRRRDRKSVFTCAGGTEWPRTPWSDPYACGSLTCSCVSASFILDSGERRICFMLCIMCFNAMHLMFMFG